MVYTHVPSSASAGDRHIAFTPARIRRRLSFWQSLRKLLNKAKIELIGLLGGLVIGAWRWYAAQSSNDQMAADAIALSLVAVVLGSVAFYLYIWWLKR